MLIPAAVIALAQQCAPDVHPDTMAALVAAESSGNPFAIGVVNSPLKKQPTSQLEAINTAKALIAKGANISAGLGQINHNNFPAFGLSLETVFDACLNLRVSGQILGDCYSRATAKIENEQDALKAAFSCYYSNNFSRGFVAEGANQPSYVRHIALSNANIKSVPQIQFTPDQVKEVSQPKQKSIEGKHDIKAIEDVKNTVNNASAGENRKTHSWDVLNDFQN